MRWFAFLCLVSILRPLVADEVITEPPAELPPPPPPIETESNWQNWIFAASLVVTAVSGIIVVSLNDGHESPSH